jgi:hypothetical protein
MSYDTFIRIHTQTQFKQKYRSTQLPRLPALYDKSIPLVYTQEIQDNNLNNIDYSWRVEKYCQNKNNSYCSIMNERYIQCNKHLCLTRIKFYVKLFNCLLFYYFYFIVKLVYVRLVKIMNNIL